MLLQLLGAVSDTRLSGTSTFYSFIPAATPHIHKTCYTSASDHQISRHTPSKKQPILSAYQKHASLRGSPSKLVVVSHWPSEYKNLITGSQFSKPKPLHVEIINNEPMVVNCQPTSTETYYANLGRGNIQPCMLTLRTGWYTQHINPLCSTQGLTG